MVHCGIDSNLEGPTVPPNTRKIFISYTESDRPWAEWIAWQVESEGYMAILQAWYFGAPETMMDAKKAGQQADVYGLGMTAIFVLYGAELPPDVPWELPKFIADLEVTEECRSVLRRAVARKIGKRWATVEEFCQAISENSSIRGRPGPGKLKIGESSFRRCLRSRAHSPWHLLRLGSFLHKSFQAATHGLAL